MIVCRIILSVLSAAKIRTFFQPAKYLAAKTPEQAAIAHDNLLGFKSRMVELLGTADERQRRKLRFQLNEYYGDFKKDYDFLAQKTQQQ